MNKAPGLNISVSTTDSSLDNLTCQGFSEDDTSDNPWHQKSDCILSNKVTFDCHPTNPQLDIQPTGHIGKKKRKEKTTLLVLVTR